MAGMSDPAQTYAQLIAAFNRSDWPQAGRLAPLLLAIDPRHPLVQYIAGVACMEQGHLPEAVAHLRTAHALDPRRADFSAHYARALCATGALTEARNVATRTLGIDISDPRALDALGTVLSLCQDAAGAVTAFARAAALDPRQPTYRLNLGSALIALGELERAEQALESCLTLDPRHWRAHFSLAHVRTQTPSDNHIARLEGLLPAGTRRPAQTCLHLALAKEYEDLGDFPRALDHLTLGKHAARPARAYRRDHEEHLFAAIEAAFPAMTAAESGHPSDAPIFIVGMPRSGTTLTDRILSSHPQVHSAGELQVFGQALALACGSQTPTLLDPQAIARAAQADWSRVGEMYLSGSRAMAGNTPHFIDKFPHNFLYLGAIARALPKARFICLRRDPMDTCLSNFRQLFATDWPYFDYAFDLLDTGHYFTLFDRLMAHWQRAMPGRVMTLHYETLVDAQEASTRALLAFCGLPWDDACLAFEQNAAPVNTPSAVQVRSPLHRRSLQRWKRYGAALDPLRSLLEHAGIGVAE